MIRLQVAMPNDQLPWPERHSTVPAVTDLCFWSVSILAIELWVRS
jgi:hypothetical protein